MSFCCIVPFMSFLNSSISSHSLYLFSLAAFLNSCTNSSIIFHLYSNLFSFATFTTSLSLSPNSFIRFARNSPIISYSKTPTSKFSKIFFFHIFAKLPCTYNSIHWIYFFTASPLIFILINNLYAITNSKTFSTILSNNCSSATFVLTPVLDVAATSCAANSTWSCACIVTSCFCYYWIICL